MKTMNENNCWNRLCFLLILQIVLLLFAQPQCACAGSVVLDWDPSADADLAGYKVYYQADSAVFPFQGSGIAEGTAPIDVANTLSAAITGLDPGSSYYFAVTAYNSAGEESVYSNIVAIPETVPPTVAIASPANNATVNGTVSIDVTAADNHGVASVQFYLNGVLLFTDSTAPYAFSWDTSSLSSGPYSILAKAYDAAGNVAQAEIAVAVAGDATAPTVAFSEPGASASVSGNVTVTASAGDDVGVTKVEIYDNGVLAFASNENPASFNWNTALEANGSHTLSARAYDAAGNVGASADLAVTVVNDLSAPSVALASPANGSTVGGSVNLSATASDDVGVTKVEFYANGSLVGTASGNPFDFSWNSTTLANGQYTLSAKAYDAAGRVGQSAGVLVTVFNDVTAPTVSMVSPMAGGTVGGSVAVSASASDDVAVTKVEFYLDGVFRAAATSAPYGFIWGTEALANGSHSLSAKAYDAAGNVGQSVTVAVNVFNDSAAPAVAIVSPIAGSTVAGTVAVSANASDDVAVSKVEFYVNGTLSATSTSAPYGFTWNTGALANGAYTLSAKAYDAAGNVGSSTGISLNVFYDRSAPTVTAFSMPAITKLTTVPVLALSATDNVAVSGYLIKESATAPSASSAGWSALAPTSFTFAGTGSRTAYVWVKDAAGNVSAASATSVLIDTTLPIISSMTLTSGSSSVTVNAAATDNVGVARMELYLNDVLQLQTSGSSFSYECPPAKRAQTVTVKVYDAAGNVRMSSLKVPRN